MVAAIVLCLVILPGDYRICLLRVQSLECCLPDITVWEIRWFPTTMVLYIIPMKIDVAFDSGQGDIQIILRKFNTFHMISLDSSKDALLSIPVGCVCRRPIGGSSNFNGHPSLARLEHLCNAQRMRTKRWQDPITQ